LKNGKTSPASCLHGAAYDHEVTYFRDLSLYSYSGYRCWALNVGWLHEAHAFDREPPSEELLDALWQFLELPVVQTRGLHECDLCSRDPDFGDRIRDVQRRMHDPADPLHELPLGKMPWPVDARRRSVLARRHGQERIIGSAEIRVFGPNGAIYAAPTLIYHYVAEHHYKPPAEFVHAALTSPRPPSDEYRALLERHEIETD
jgi:hypothetical protein